MARSFLKVFFDFEERTEKLSETERGRLLLGMLRYAKTGEQPELTGNEQFVWPVFRGEIDKEIENYEIKVANGRNGGRPPKETEENRNKPNKTERNRNGAGESAGGFLHEQEQEQDQEQEHEQEQDQEDRESTDDDDDIRARAREAAVRKSFLISFGRTGTPEEVSSLCGTASIYGYGPDLAAEALRVAAMFGARNPASYAKQVMAEWSENDVRTMEDANMYQVRKDAQTGRNTRVLAMMT